MKKATVNAMIGMAIALIASLALATVVAAGPIATLP
jgi:hypothetical protein